LIVIVSMSSTSIQIKINKTRVQSKNFMFVYKSYYSEIDENLHTVQKFHDKSDPEIVRADN
jgi:hypothetical protein